MSTISIQTILEYYAIFCLAMSPLSVMLFVILYRKTNLVDRIDKLVDRILGIKELPAQEKNQQKDETESSAKPAAETQELTGVACFSLKVDDVYYCRKNAQLFNGGYHEIQWSCDNEFLGQINHEGRFKSQRMGTANIYCARKDDPFASAVHAYSISIKPTNENWFAQWLMDAVLGRKKKADVLSDQIKSKITDEIPPKGIIEYEGQKDYTKMVLQFDSADCLERGVLFVRASETDRLDSALGERFEQVRLQNDGRTKIWVHRIIDESKDEIDIYAYQRRTSHDEYILGFSQNWREYGDVEEFLLNIGMTVKVFADCITGDKPETPVPVPDAPLNIKDEKTGNDKEQPHQEDGGTGKQEQKIETEITATEPAPAPEPTAESSPSEPEATPEGTDENMPQESNDDDKDKEEKPQDGNESFEDADFGNGYEQYDDYTEE